MMDYHDPQQEYEFLKDMCAPGNEEKFKAYNRLTAAVSVITLGVTIATMAIAGAFNKNSAKPEEKAPQKIEQVQNERVGFSHMRDEFKKLFDERYIASAILKAYKAPGF